MSGDGSRRVVMRGDVCEQPPPISGQSGVLRAGEYLNWRRPERNVQLLP